MTMTQASTVSGTPEVDSSDCEWTPDLSQCVSDSSVSVEDQLITSRGFLEVDSDDRFGRETRFIRVNATGRVVTDGIDALATSEGHALYEIDINSIGECHFDFEVLNEGGAGGAVVTLFFEIDGEEVPVESDDNGRFIDAMIPQFSDAFFRVSADAAPPIGPAQGIDESTILHGRLIVPEPGRAALGALAAICFMAWRMRGAPGENRPHASPRYGR